MIRFGPGQKRKSKRKRKKKGIQKSIQYRATPLSNRYSLLTNLIDS